MAPRTVDISAFNAEAFEKLLMEEAERHESGVGKMSPVHAELMKHKEVIRRALGAGVGTRRITQLLNQSGMEVGETSVKTFISSHMKGEGKRASGRKKSAKSGGKSVGTEGGSSAPSSSDQGQKKPEASAEEDEKMTFAEDDGDGIDDYLNGADEQAIERR